MLVTFDKIRFLKKQDKKINSLDDKISPNYTSLIKYNMLNTINH